ncbi:MAG TPA: DUF4080 domain-containing protein [Spirochaetota bacterium]|nr:DUF4080 domain-containing protein [Spirochaetota bacterium]
MKKILFIAINARYVHSNLALLYLKKTVSDLQYDSAILEFSINEKNEKILASIIGCNPDIIALSVYIWNSSIIKTILPDLKKINPSVKIVCGGPELSYNAAEWINDFPQIDYIITGGGEAGFRELALLDFNSSERIISRINLPFRDVPFPYDDAEMKRLSGRFIYYESSRGCPFRCSYCLSSRSDQNLDFRNPDQVKDELDFFKFHKPRLVKFVDRTFNSRKDHYRGIWEYIVSNFSAGGTLFHFEIYPELLDSEDIAFLSTVPAGLFQFEMGIQSLKSETLAAINRSVRKNGWIENIKAIADRGNIHLHVDLIAGLPHESYSNFKESFDTVHDIGAHHFQCGFLKVLPGTEMIERSDEFGLEFSPIPPYQVRSNRWISFDEMRRLERVAELLEIFYNSGRFRETERFLTEKTGSSFSFYEKLEELYRGDVGLNCREWPGAAALLMKYAEETGVTAKSVLTDYLRWDWCSSMKLHHYPAVISSDYTTEIKRKGYNRLIQFSDKGIISFHGVQFSRDELRRGIFFKAESDEFIFRMKISGYHLILPDKRNIEFDI